MLASAQPSLTRASPSLPSFLPFPLRRCSAGDSLFLLAAPIPPQQLYLSPSSQLFPGVCTHSLTHSLTARRTANYFRANLQIPPLHLSLFRRPKTDSADMRRFFVGFLPFLLSLSLSPSLPLPKRDPATSIIVVRIIVAVLAVAVIAAASMLVCAQSSPSPIIHGEAALPLPVGPRGARE